MSTADASAFEGHEELVAELRANRPVAPDRLREQVLAVGQERRRPSRRRLVLVVVPVAVAAAVGAALVHGFVSSGSHEAFLRANPRVPGTVIRGISGQGATRGIQHQATQSSGTAVEAAPAFKASTPLSLAGSSARYDAVNIPRNRLVHADASLEVQVKTRSALSKATNSATQVVAA